MATKMTFGECLKFLLSTLDISMNRLSKAINVDNSLVNRWVHGKRIPSYGTAYINSIAEYLSKNIHNTFQMKRLNELLLSICKDSDLRCSNEEKIKKILLEAQGYSIECKKKQGKEIKKQTYNKSVALSNDDKIIFGADDIFSAGISLLKIAASQRPRGNNTIYVTYNNEIKLTSKLNNRLIHYEKDLLQALNNGWQVFFLLRLNNNIDRIKKLIALVLPFLKTGKFYLYYYDKYGVLAEAKETYVVSGLGALSCISTKSSEEVDCAFYFKSRPAIDALRNYLEVLLKTYAKPLVNFYPPDLNIKHSYFLTKIEESIGNCYMYKPDLNISLIPEQLYKKLINSVKLSYNEEQIALKLYQAQLKTFLINIHNYEYKEIYLVNFIERLIIHQQLYFYCYPEVKVINLEFQDVIEILENTITLLRTYNNYYIAFISQKADSNVNLDDFFCVIKERKAVFYEIYESSTRNLKMQITIEEPMVIKAFEDYFKDIWEQIAPINKEKKEIIAWIQNQINIFKDNAIFE